MTSNKSTSSIESGGNAGKLKKSMGLIDGISIIIGVIVGSGIFISPKGIVQNVDSMGLSLIVWALCGLITLCGALSYAQLGTLIKKSGSEYSYILEIFGPVPAFMVVWTAMIIIMPTSHAVIALTFSKYIISTIYRDCQQPEYVEYVISALVVSFITSINCYSVKFATSIQKIFLVAKMCALFGIIGLGIYGLTLGDYKNISRGFEGSTYNIGALSLALYSGLFSYGGWTYLNYVTEELKEPQKNLPRAIVVSIVGTTILYLMVNVSYFVILSPFEISTSDAVGVQFLDKLFPKLTWIITLCVALSTFGSLNGCIMTSSRLFFVAARNGHMPTILSTVNVTRITPITSLVFVGLSTMIMVFVGNVYTLINYILFPLTSFSGIAVLGLLKLRYDKVDIDLKIHISIPIIFTIASVFLTLVPLITNFYTTAIALGIMLSSIPVYLLCTKVEKSSSLKKFITNVTIFSQKVSYSVESKNV